MIMDLRNGSPDRISITYIEVVSLEWGCSPNLLQLVEMCLG